MTAPQIAVAGTSIEAADPGWVSVLAELVGPDAGGAPRVVSWGTGGACYAHPVAGTPLIGDHVRAMVAQHGPPAVLILGGPINDLIRSVDTYAARNSVFSLIQWAGSQGTVALPCTITPFRFDHVYAAALNARRADFNGWARSQLGHPYVNACIDFGDVLATASGFADPRYMADSNHPGPAGWPLLAAAAHTVLRQRGHL